VGSVKVGDSVYCDKVH